MPQLKFKIPSYRLHKASGQAVVTLNGKDVYLGPHGTPESKAEYDRVIEEWLASHKQLPPQPADRPTPGRTPDLAIDESFLPYWDFVRQYYRKNGQPTSEVDSIRRALTPVLELYGRQPARSFGPLALKVCRQRMIDDGLTRGAINKHVGRIKRFFKWAAENELMSPEVFHALSTVSGLRRGRAAAQESQPVRPVADEVVEATLPHLNRYVAAMVQLQQITGMRPGEVVVMRTRDVDRTAAVWSYRPYSHKTEHHNRERLIYLGPQAQAVLSQFLLANPDLYIFSPKRVLEEHRAELRARRVTPMTPSQKRRRRKRNPRKMPGDHYTTRSYFHALQDACDRAFPVPEGYSKTQAKQWRREHWWSPNRLRHTAATRLRKQFGLDAARVILGHSSPVVTEIYAELDHARAAEIMGRVG